MRLLLRQQAGNGRSWGHFS